ncbi:DUF2812 domain-containing protein [Planomicrobium okeanokoites]|uniref:DUF2812 domain-containing protein n=1 Tax=Planomicrobium okeanokoites TaxID=244 RepID=A0ABV7KS64_PLAOK|nr:DUF2812 domain-containing protein [Planomicrobium okeanokoites]TAA70122.1 DUF2812 domain-containing protein [Planomicrobium okeanokoites]
MKKIYRPFWSYDVKQTEDWLAEMAAQGLIFTKLNRWTRCFYFQEQEPATRVYRIAYNKMSSSVLPKTLQAEGWEKAGTAGNWEFTFNEQPESAIKTSPIREGIIKHNRMITYIYYGISFYVAGMLMANISMLASSYRQDGGINIVESPLWILTFIFFAILLGTMVLGIYSIAKITGTNKELDGTTDGFWPVDEIDQQGEKELKKAGRWVTKVKFSWMYSPDKMEQWLESMEQRGLNLYRVNKIGTIFHFVKGEPRRIAYSIDYQRGPTESYFAIHREAGWHEEFTSFSNMEKWTIWSKTYGETEERPQLYSDQSSRLKHAKRIALTYTAMFSPLVAFYIYFIINIMSSADTIQDRFLWNSSGMMLLAVLIFGTFIVRIWSYYGRLRKQAAAWSN